MTPNPIEKDDHEHEESSSSSTRMRLNRSRRGPRETAFHRRKGGLSQFTKGSATKTRRQPTRTKSRSLSPERRSLKGRGMPRRTRSRSLPVSRRIHLNHSDDMASSTKSRPERKNNGRRVERTRNRSRSLGSDRPSRSRPELQKIVRTRSRSLPGSKKYGNTRNTRGGPKSKHSRMRTLRLEAGQKNTEALVRHETYRTKKESVRSSVMLQGLAMQASQLALTEKDHSETTMNTMDMSTSSFLSDSHHDNCESTQEISVRRIERNDDQEEEITSPRKENEFNKAKKVITKMTKKILGRQGEMFFFSSNLTSESPQTIEPESETMAVAAEVDRQESQDSEHSQEIEEIQFKYQVKPGQMDDLASVEFVVDDSTGDGSTTKFQVVSDGFGK